MRLNKMLSITAATLLAFNLVACSSDDDDDEEDSRPIPGNAEGYLLQKGATGGFFITRLFNTGNGSDGGDDQPITGLPAGEELVGMDFRPRDGKLYLVGKNGGSANSLGAVYVINSLGTAGNMAATLVSELAADPNDTSEPFTGLDAAAYGIDFNPQANALRLVDNTGNSLRIPFGGTGAIPAQLIVISDGDTKIGETIKTGLVGSAYTNNVDGATSTRLLAVSNSPAELFEQVPATGALTRIAALTDDGAPVDAGTGFSFDILSSGGTETGFFVGQQRTSPRDAAFGMVDLSTGALTVLQSTEELEEGVTIVGLAMKAAAN